MCHNVHNWCLIDAMIRVHWGNCKNYSVLKGFCHEHQLSPIHRIENNCLISRDLTARTPTRMKVSKPMCDWRRVRACALLHHSLSLGLSKIVKYSAQLSLVAPLTEQRPPPIRNVSPILWIGSLYNVYYISQPMYRMGELEDCNITKHLIF